MVDQMNIAGKQPVQVRRKKRGVIKRYVLGTILLCLFAASSVLGIIEYLNYTGMYHKDVALAQGGIQHLQKAEAMLAALPKNPLDSQPVAQAHYEFTAALSAFLQVGADLKSLPGVSTSIPMYGAQVSAALHLLPLAIEVSQAGAVACDTLNLIISRLHNPLDTQAQGLTMADLTVVGQNFRQLKMTLDHLIDQINHLQPGDLKLDPRLGKFIDTFHKDIPILQDRLIVAEDILTLAPSLLGISTPANYLIEMLDSTELRPGGGFIGNYGVVTLSGGRLADVNITDVDLIDKPFELAGNTIPYPSAYTWFDLAPDSWSFRDSNLDADFPTVARYGEQTYTREGGKVPVQGVIAITPWLIQHALEITGPISMLPQYNEVVTAQNLVDRIHFHQLGRAGEGSELIPAPDGHSSLRKRFTAYLAEHFFARVRQLSLSSSALPKFFQMLVSALHTKDIQVYFNSSAGENLLHRNDLDAAIQAPVGDSLFVVDANISPNKANDFITYKLNDQVVIDTTGTALHHTTLSYAWSVNGTNYGSPIYRDYVRVYVPPGSSLHMQNGWEPREAVQAFGREVWAGLFTLSFGQTRVITLIWSVHGAAQKDAYGWHYQYLLQKQAGDQWMLDLQVTLPECAVIANNPGGLVSRARNTATLTRILSEDLSPGIDYHC